MSGLEYDVELDRVREDKTSEETRDTIKAVRQALEKIDLLLKDIDSRLKEGGL
jgi:hypothetical protein